MYLSKLIVNTSNPTILRSMVDPYEAHRTIWRGFPSKGNGGPGRVLFRLEHRKTPPYLVVLVQSHPEPDWQSLLQQGILLDAKSKELTPDRLDQLTRVGRSLRFRLMANPTARRIVDESERDKKGRPKRGRVGLFGDAQQMEWLRGKAEKGGFRMLDCRISSRGHLESAKPGKKERIRHLCVTFDGILEVTDAGTFRSTLESGIGSAKGFGFGLLSVAPVGR